MIYIHDEIIIVEKTSSGQGYIVNPNDKKQLEKAIGWGKSWDYVLDENGKCIEELVEGTSYTRYKTKDAPAIVHTYKNGQFKIKLYESAHNSYSQSGKLSFWNCTITAPDGKEFIIGINAELLLDLLKNCTIVNGEIQGDVWLGREKGQVGVYTETMESFKQAQLDKEKKANLKKGTTKYVVGDIVETLTQKDVYLGEMYKYFDICESYNWGHYGDWVVTVTIFNQPRKVHLFIGENRVDNLLSGKYEWYLYSDDIKPSKPSRLVTGRDERITAQSVYDNYTSSDEHDFKKFHLQYSIEKKDGFGDKQITDAIKEYLKGKYKLNDDLLPLGWGMRGCKLSIIYED